jgi:hypothetical protein
MGFLARMNAYVCLQFISLGKRFWAQEATGFLASMHSPYMSLQVRWCSKRLCTLGATVGFLTRMNCYVCLQFISLDKRLWAQGATVGFLASMHSSYMSLQVKWLSNRLCTLGATKKRLINEKFHCFARTPTRPWVVFSPHDLIYICRICKQGHVLLDPTKKYWLQIPIAGT